MRTEIVYDTDRLESLGTDELAVYPSQSAGYLRALDRSGVGEREPRHILVLDRDRALAFAPCYVQTSSEYDDLENMLTTRTERKFFKIARRTGIFPEFSPALVCASPEAFYTRLSAPSPDPSARRKLASALIDGVRDLASEEGTDLCGFLNVPSRDEGLWEELVRRGYGLFTRARSAYLPLPWAGFKEYLGSLSRNQRKGYRSEINRAERCGLSIREVRDYLPLASTLSEIVAEAWYVRGKNSPFTPRYYRSMATCLAGNSSVLVGCRDGEIHGFTLLFWKGDRMCAYQYAGRPNEFVRSSNLYFNICYNEAIDRAMKMGMKEIRYGPATLHVKVRRGCSLEDLGVFLRPRRRRHMPALKFMISRNISRRRADQVS